MSGIADRLWETARLLPEPLQVQVLDFAEFLRARQNQGAPLETVALRDLCGGLGATGTFAGSAIDIQQRLRDEWH